MCNAFIHSKHGHAPRWKMFGCSQCLRCLVFVWLVWSYYYRIAGMDVTTMSCLGCPICHLPCLCFRSNVWRIWRWRIGSLLGLYHALSTWPMSRWALRIVLYLSATSPCICFFIFMVCWSLECSTTRDGTKQLVSDYLAEMWTWKLFDLYQDTLRGVYW